jgi:hypothetical protein
VSTADDSCPIAVASAPRADRSSLFVEPNANSTHTANAPTPNPARAAASMPTVVNW